MRQKISAGLLMYRLKNGALEVLIAHPGGPFFARRDDDCWSIPKGEVEPGESLLHAAIREFREEVGIEPAGPYLDLGSIRQRSGKIVYGWAFEGDWENDRPLQSTYFELEWPPGSGRKHRYPEVDRAGFYSFEQARPRLKAAQHAFIERLVEKLARLQGQPNLASLVPDEGHNPAPHQPGGAAPILHDS